jgi:hypothetical protein
VAWSFALLALVTLADAKAPLGLNLAGVTDWSSELVFVDAFKAARPWISQAQGKPWGQGGPLDLDPKGNVKLLRDGQFAEAVVYTDFGDRFPAGVFTCYYDGKGELDFAMDAKVIDRRPNWLQVEIKPKNGMTTCRLMKTEPKDPIRNIRLIHPGHERTYLEQPFHPDFLKRWQGFRVLRFMDWQRTNGSKIKEWDERSTPDQHSQAVNGVAPEYMIQLCNQLKIDPWFCMPHRASDGFVTRFAELVKAKLDPARKVYVEYSNECWNGQFEQARYCQEQGKRGKLSDNAYEAQLRYFSQRSVAIFKIWERVLGGKDRLVRVLAAQSANPWTGATVMDWKDACKHADAIAIAPYFGHRWGDPKKAEQTAALPVEQLMQALEEDLKESHKHVKTYAAEAKKRGLKLLAYEGGQHLAGHGGAENDDRLTQLFFAANRHPRMKDMYLQDLQHWQEAGGDVFCIFSSMGRYSKWGSWGLLEHAQQEPKNAPKYQAVREYLER